MKTLTLIILSLAFMGSKNAPVTEVSCSENTTAKTIYIYASGSSSCDKSHSFVSNVFAVSCDEWDGSKRTRLAQDFELNFIDELKVDYKSYTNYPCSLFTTDDIVAFTFDSRSKADSHRRSALADYSRHDFIIHKAVYFSYSYDCPDY